MMVPARPTAQTSETEVPSVSNRSCAVTALWIMRTSPRVEVLYGWLLVKVARYWRYRLGGAVMVAPPASLYSELHADHDPPGIGVGPVRTARVSDVNGCAVESQAMVFQTAVEDP